MKPIPSREFKVNYLYWHNNATCGCGKPLTKTEYKCYDLVNNLDLHHRLKDSKGNRKNFPLFIDSILNLQLIRHGCHIDGKHLEHFTEYQAEKYERCLKKHPMICKFVNGEL